MLSFVTQVGRVADPARLLAGSWPHSHPIVCSQLGEAGGGMGRHRGALQPRWPSSHPAWASRQAAPFSFLLTPCLRSSLWRQSVRPHPAPRSCQALDGRVPCVSTTHRLSTISRRLLCWVQNIPLTPAPPLPFCSFSKLFVFAQNNHREVWAGAGSRECSGRPGGFN